MSEIHAGAVIYAKDFLRIAYFYKAVAGFDMFETAKTHAKLESGPFQLILLQIPKAIAETFDVRKPPLRREHTPIKLVFFMGSIEKTRQVVKEQGAELDDVKEEWEYDERKVCDGHDPEGNVFQLRALIHQQALG